MSVLSVYARAIFMCNVSGEDFDISSLTTGLNSADHAPVTGHTASAPLPLPHQNFESSSNSTQRPYKVPRILSQLSAGACCSQGPF